VAVLCPDCGRSYDVTLFGFGRTLHCACGRRVGLAHRLPLSGEGSAPRLLADAMLGRLARWLRLLGVDTAYEPHISDEHLVRRALAEGRRILTRDRALCEEWRVSGILRVESEELRAQLRQVVRVLDLAGRLRPFTRCSRCNAPLEDAPPEAVRQRVPARVRALETRFRVCPECGRVYWWGSHAERIAQVAREILEAR